MKNKCIILYTLVQIGLSGWTAKLKIAIDIISGKMRFNIANLINIERVQEVLNLNLEQVAYFTFYRPEISPKDIYQYVIAIFLSYTSNGH
jgi:hypothetical protein